jgi:hypothetical protein
MHARYTRQGGRVRSSPHYDDSPVRVEYQVFSRAG